jgi:hypothetical protein
LDTKDSPTLYDPPVDFTTAWCTINEDSSKTMNQNGQQFNANVQFIAEAH